MELYRQWLRVVQTHEEATALVVPAEDRRWSFTELGAEVEQRPPVNARYRVVRGTGSEIVIRTLVAWRDGVVLVPWDGDVEQASGDDAAVLAGLPAVAPEGTCHVKRTSGSTGDPRNVWFSAAQLGADADHIVSTMGLRSEWPNVGVISLAHSYGFSSLVLPLLLHGIPLILGRDALPETVGRLLDAYQKVTLPAVPAMWKAWHRYGILSSRTIGLAISAGAPLTVALEQAVYERTGLKIHNFYGSTECGGIAYDGSERPRSDGSYVGRAMDGVRLDTVEGRLRVQGPSVALGYVDRRSEDDLVGGAFVTADQAEIDAAGRVFLLGRESDTINIAGRKLAPQAVEEVLQALPGVKQALVFGVPSKDTERVDEIVAMIRLSEAGVLEEIVEQVAPRLAAWRRPRHWWVCESLNPDARGKLSRVAWRARYLEQEGRSASGG